MGKINNETIYMSGEKMGKHIMKTYYEYKEIKQLREEKGKKTIISVKIFHLYH